LPEWEVRPVLLSVLEYLFSRPGTAGKRIEELNPRTRKTRNGHVCSGEGVDGHERVASAAVKGSRGHHFVADATESPSPSASFPPVVLMSSVFEGGEG
jgi:hypothetical protein